MSLDPGIVDAFVQSARETLGTMAMMDLEIREVSTSPSPTIEADVVSSVGLSGEHSGVLCLACPNDFAATFVAAMLGIDVDKLDPGDIEDGAGEFVNMVAGGAKRILAERNYCFDLALPTVAIGNGEPVQTHGFRGARIHASTGSHEFSLFVSMD